MKLKHHDYKLEERDGRQRCTILTDGELEAGESLTVALQPIEAVTIDDVEIVGPFFIEQVQVGRCLFIDGPAIPAAAFRGEELRSLNIYPHTGIQIRLRTFAAGAVKFEIRGTPVHPPLPPPS